MAGQFKLAVGGRLQWSWVTSGGSSLLWVFFFFFFFGFLVVEDLLWGG